MIQAGAGSGKTYRISTEIVRRLATGQAQPERILATTFTRKAAAELKDRIQQRLLRPADDDKALHGLSMEARIDLVTRLDQALIGTVHSIAHRLTSRYALASGLSPELQTLEEKSQTNHLRRIYDEMDPEGLLELAELGRRLGHDDPQKLVLDVLDAKRGNDIDDDTFRQSMIDGIERFIAIISGGTSEPVATWDALYEEARRAAETMQTSEDETKATRDAIDVLRDMYRGHRMIWRDWGKASSIEPGAKSRAAVAALNAMARRANVHAELHADLRRYNDCLVERCLELQGRYAGYKAERGLIDFTDLEVHFLALLRDPDTLKELTSLFDLVVVDEFQDTNPIQLAIFERLARGTECLWVGDEKQAIYGFRGTDPQLMAEVLATIPEAQRDRLKTSYRSLPRLVEYANEVFTPIFGNDTPLRGHREGAGRVFHWRLQGRFPRDQDASLVARLQEFLADQPPEDVALLVSTNRQAASLAERLTAAGIPAMVRRPGLLQTREATMALAGLRRVSDRRDPVAAATLAHVTDLDPTPAWFRQAAAGEPLTAPDVDALDVRAMSPRAALQAVIEAVRLPDLVAQWGDPGRRMANLDALLEAAADYEEQSRQEGKAATLTGLLYWFDDKERKEEDRLPLPQGASAVTIMTYWRAKGLQWPTVIVYSHERRPADLFSIHLEGGDPTGDPLAGRRMHYWPYPFGTTSFGGRNKEACGVTAAIEASPEGEARQRRSDEEFQRLMYVAFTRAKDTLVIAETKRSKLAEWVPLAAADETLEPAGVPEPVDGIGKISTWFEPRRGQDSFVARYHAPSQVTAEGRAKGVRIGEPIPVGTDDWTSLGQAVHAYFASLPALAELDDGHLGHAQACLERWGQGGAIEPEHLVAAGNRLRQWQDGDWHVEVPISLPREGGGQWQGIADLVIDGDQRLVIDHKSVDLSSSGWEERAATYAGQLQVYVRALDAAAGYIYFGLAGGMAKVDP